MHIPRCEDENRTFICVIFLIRSTNDRDSTEGTLGVSVSRVSITVLWSIRAFSTNRMRCKHAVFKQRFDISRLGKINGGRGRQLFSSSAKELAAPMYTRGFVQNVCIICACQVESIVDGQ